MKKSTKIAIAAGITIGAAALYPAQAHADLTNYEVVGYGDDSYNATCSVMDEMFTGVVANNADVVEGINQAMREMYSINAYEAVQVINYQVAIYCDEHWDEITAIGDAARGEATVPAETFTPVVPVEPAPIEGGIGGRIG